MIPPVQTGTSFSPYCYQCKGFVLINYQGIVAHIFIAKYGAKG